MSLLLTAGFFLIGAAIAGAALIAFWDDIKNWLNTVAADAIERALGYSARNRIQKAVAVVDKVVSKVKSTSTIYTKKTATATYFDKTTVTASCEASELDEAVIEELRKHNNKLVQEFGYSA